MQRGSTGSRFGLRDSERLGSPRTRTLASQADRVWRWQRDNLTETTMPTITTKDAAIFYKDWGTGRPVVFSHGWPLNADAWDCGCQEVGARHATC
ncbi:MAG: non-heme chloroperoxidase [Pseudonocardiales bacterium]|jgi:hypothetical protein|nr:non-heme chloroperoxidase [Pseudonocardiales bacterium]